MPLIHNVINPTKWHKWKPGTHCFWFDPDVQKMVPVDILQVHRNPSGNPIRATIAISGRPRSDAIMVDTDRLFLDEHAANAALKSQKEETT